MWTAKIWFFILVSDFMLFSAIEFANLTKVLWFFFSSRKNAFISFKGCCIVKRVNIYMFTEYSKNCDTRVHQRCVLCAHEIKLCISISTDTLKYTDLKIIMWDHTIIIAISQLLHDTNACINLYHVITAFAM